MYCLACGKKIPNLARFCVYCGAVQNDSADLEGPDTKTDSQTMRSMSVDSTQYSLLDALAVEEDQDTGVSPEELADALNDVLLQLSEGLTGPDRKTYLKAVDLAQNNYFCAGASEAGGRGTFEVSMWTDDGEETLFDRHIGDETKVHKLASNPDKIAFLHSCDTTQICAILVYSLPVGPGRAFYL